MPLSIIAENKSFASVKVWSVFKQTLCLENIKSILGSNLYNFFNLVPQFKRSAKFGFLSSVKIISYVFLVNKF